MPTTPSPNVQRRRLSIKLRQLREASGMSCEQVGAKLDCTSTRISRVETGRIGIRPGDVRELLDVCSDRLPRFGILAS